MLPQCLRFDAEGNKPWDGNVTWGGKQGMLSILDDFIEICEDFMLIHKGEMMAIILHQFVSSMKTSEHVQTLGDLFRYSGTILRSCFRESQMALFEHWFCWGDLIVASKHVQTLGDLFRYSGTILCSCSQESRMALFGHRFCLGNFIVASEHVHTLGDLFQYGGTILHSCSREFRMALFGHRFCQGNFIVASEHVQTLGDLFGYSGTILLSYFRESRMALFRHRFCRGDLTVDMSIPFHSPDGCSFIKPFFPSRRLIFFPLGISTPTKEKSELKKLGRKKNWSITQMIGRLNSCKQICVHNSRPGSKSLTASSPKNCPSALLEWGEVVLKLWRSRKTTSPHRIRTGTCLILWSRGFWKVNVPCHICSFLAFQALWGKKKMIT